MDPVAERGLWLRHAAHRGDLATFVDHAMRLDDAAVIRLRARSAGLLTAWVATGFDVLASRVVVGEVRPDDLSAAADALARGLSAVDASGYVDPGFAMDSAWRGALPPESGFTHLDDVPARVMLDLAQRGRDSPRNTAVPMVRRSRCSTRRSFESVRPTSAWGSPCAVCSP